MNKKQNKTKSLLRLEGLQHDARRNVAAPVGAMNISTGVMPRDLTAKAQGRDLFVELLAGVKSLADYEAEQRLLVSISHAGIANETDYLAALKIVERVMDQSRATKARENQHWDGTRLLEILAPHIEVYERRHYPMPD